jgi:ATP-dependent Lon protease
MFEDSDDDTNLEMGDANINIDKILCILVDKVSVYEKIITKTKINSDNYMKMNIFTTSETNCCLSELNIIIDDVRLLEVYLKDNESYDVDNVINDIQTLNNKLSSIVKKYGTMHVKDLIYVCLGNNYLEQFDVKYRDKFDLIKRYMHPIGYKLISDSLVNKSAEHNSSGGNAILEDFRICETGDNCSCYNFVSNKKGLRLNTIKVVIKDIQQKQSLIIYGYVDDLIFEYILNNNYIHEKYYSLKQMKPMDSENYDYKFDIYMNSLSLKDYLIYDVNEIYDRYNGYLMNAISIKSKSLNKVVNDFLKADFDGKRVMLIELLIHSNDKEFMYLAYLLYDTMTADDDDKSGDEQDILYSSLPWVIKSKFKCAMKQTIDYTNNLMNYDVNNKLPIEQRICLMKCSDKVKEKAMVKLKEVKSKTDDSATKSRQYLDGLLKIPFGIFKREQIFDIIDENNNLFSNMLDAKDNCCHISSVTKKDKYTSIEIKNTTRAILLNMGMESFAAKMKKIINRLDKLRKKELLSFIGNIRDIFVKNNIVLDNSANISNLLIGDIHGEQKDVLRTRCHQLLSMIHNDKILDEVLYHTDIIDEKNLSMYKTLSCIQNNCVDVNKYMGNVRKCLDDSVYGHDDAKRQIERIVGQWINGNDGGYCLGFEGPPGTGKTSIAKYGLSQCLVDDNGEKRPFSFIAIGGSSNGSTLEGHNYTYVGSTWGRVVDILMEQKCMNPIIFIDEIDKVSKTENGREIISILTHLVDPTQNDSFQDKYFSGIDIDVSKILFVFSYNDVSLIDRILLDRIHRIKFDNLTTDDKLVICNKHMLPELLNKMGQFGNIEFSDEVLAYIINSYTHESGVRKLKELLYEIIGEINLLTLNDMLCEIEIPVIVTEDDVTKIYLKDHHKMNEKKVTPINKIGIICGLYANALGRGGVIPIETSLFVTRNLLDLKLTGQQGDVMKESMTVAKTLAWSLTSKKRQTYLMKDFNTTNNQGIHIHCPEGATPKDGPSAGTAITIAIYSLLNNIPIKYDLAITGEMNLQGCVTAIGGLDLKIIGGINTGVKTFLYPSDNKRDFDKFMDKYRGNSILDGIMFHSIDTIHDALKLSLVNT